MNIRSLLLLVAILTLASSLRLTHEANNYDTCLYLPLGHIYKTDDFNYTITTAWTPEQVPLLKNGSLNTSDFIKVQGWVPYSKPYAFFEHVGRHGEEIIRKLVPTKSVLKGSDAPQFYLSDSDL